MSSTPVNVGNSASVSLGDANYNVTAGSNDKITVGNGADTITAGANDKITAGNGNDTITAGANSTITAGSGNDTITAGANSSVTAGSGNDTVSVGANSTVNLGSGNDTVYMAANDTVTVGSGIDTFIFQASKTPTLAAPRTLTVNEDGTIALPVSVGADGFGRDTIVGFLTAKDVIQFDTSQFANFAAVQAAAKQVNKDTVITYDANNSITLNGVTASSLKAGNFAFVNPGSGNAVTVTISGLPSDAKLSNSAGALTVNNGSITLTAAQLAGLAITAGEATSANLTVTVSSGSGATAASVSQTIALTVNAIAPTLAIVNHALALNEGGTIALGISETPFDARDVVAVTISGVPHDASLSAGTRNGDGSWTLAPAQLAGLNLIAGDETTATLTVTATNLLGATASAPSQTIALTVNAVAEIPQLTAQNVTGRALRSS
jgi:hypothetical protein